MFELCCVNHINKWIKNGLIFNLFTLFLKIYEFEGRLFYITYRIYLYTIPVIMMVVLYSHIIREMKCQNRINNLKSNGNRKVFFENVKYSVERVYFREMISEKFTVTIIDKDTGMNYIGKIKMEGKAYKCNSNKFRKKLEKESIEVLIDKKDISIYHVMLEELADVSEMVHERGIINKRIGYLTVFFYMVSWGIIMISA